MRHIWPRVQLHMQAAVQAAARGRPPEVQRRGIAVQAVTGHQARVAHVVVAQP